MVISRKDGLIFVILADDEFLPEKFDVPTVVVFRQGTSTNRELLLVKEAGKLADKSLLRPPSAPDCDYAGDMGPLHQHSDGSFWYYDETWSFENGPFENSITAEDSLMAYCQDVLKEREEFLLTNPENSDTISEEDSNETSD
jgi:hypothetical protein